MATDNVQFQSSTLASPPADLVVETKAQADGSERQVVEIGSVSAITNMLVSLADLSSRMSAVLNVLTAAMATSNDPWTGRKRVSIEQTIPLPENIVGFGSTPHSTQPNTVPADTMLTAWATSVRARIT